MDAGCEELDVKGRCMVAIIIVRIAVVLATFSGKPASCLHLLFWGLTVEANWPSTSLPWL